MKAYARISAEADGRGGTRLTELYGEAPLLPRRTGPSSVHLVGGAAGPLGGDEFFLDLYVGPQATLTLSTVAASLVLPGDGPSRTRITATVEGRLEFLPEPIVAVRGCDHLATTQVDIGRLGELVWREELVWGRHGEDGGNLVLATTLRRAGAVLYRQDLAVGPRTPGWSGPAVLGGARTTGSILFVGSHVPASLACDGDGFAVATMALGADAAVTSAVAHDAHTLRHALSIGLGQ